MSEVIDVVPSAQILQYITGSRANDTVPFTTPRDGRFAFNNGADWCCIEKPRANKFANFNTTSVVFIL